MAALIGLLIFGDDSVIDSRVHIGVYMHGQIKKKQIY